jgi:hypothetical protein
MNRNEAFQNLVAVFNQLGAARFSLHQAISAVSRDPTRLPDGLTPIHLQDCADNLEVTYLTRLFAEFEGVLREFYWSAIRPGRRPRWTPIEIMMDRIAARLYIPYAELQRAHEVRAYRNDVIHDRLRTPRLAFQDCRSRLGKYIYYLPTRW